MRSEVLDNLSDDRFKLKLGELMRPILTFQESVSVSTIWEKMLATKEHISVIIDEYGSMRGIVTMEDVIETMLGVEIVDESDEAVNMRGLAQDTKNYPEECMNAYRDLSSFGLEESHQRALSVHRRRQDLESRQPGSVYQILTE